MTEDNRFLLLCDLDGTLLDSSGRVSEKNISAIRDFERKGGLFAIATGRTQHTALKHIQYLPVNCPCILYNGAAIYDFSKGSFLYLKFIEDGSIWGIVKEDILSFRNVCVQAFVKDSIYVISRGDVLDPLLLSEDQKFSISRPDEVQEDLIKIIISGESDDLLTIRERLAQTATPLMANVMRTAECYLELLPPGISKGTTLLYLSEALHIPMERTIAIGDYQNDVDMIRMAGVGAAPCNAHASALEVADIIVSSNDDHALADLLSRLT